MVPELPELNHQLLYPNLGYRVILVEKDKTIGGKINNYYHLFPNSRPALMLKHYIDEQCKKHDLTIYKNTEIQKIQKNR